ncbi:E3 ubiquitin-protein ligase TRIM33-like, partial [Drosophila obscura]|uniref:E3 ubiquitin-protein ligase TRIM33-like n=1 Tax=Drosophila obscura TaxID=7282 RepID=UPI001BB15ED5
CQLAGHDGHQKESCATRQPRVKRDSDSLSSTNQISPDTAATTLDFDPFNAAGVTSATARDYSTTGAHHLHHQHPHQHQQQQQQQHHHQQPPPHHHHHLLTVPTRSERHASEPAPSLGPSTPHLLSVPSSTPYLIKQHSDPLLPRQSALHSASGSLAGGTNPFAPLHRQYSHPLSGSNAGYVPPAPLHHPHHISLPESIYASGSPPPAGSSQYMVPTRVVACPVSSETAATPSIASSNATSATVGAVSVVTSPTTASLNSSRHSFSPTYAGSSSETAPPERRSPHSHSPTVTHSHSLVERTSKGSDAANGSGVTKLRNSKSVTGTGSSSHLHPGQTAMSSSFEHLPTLRVKNEELQRSVSSPQTQREIITLENPRSSHCPVIRPGPALGCNFCWNTIDGHGRILRRKTKYHCPECQTNLCIVPCFQEYHERLNNEAATVGASNSSGHDNQVHSSSTGSSSGSVKAASYVSASSTSSGSGSGTGTGAARHYTKTESI